MFAGAWLLAELARGVIFTGFPWVASGYAHVDSPFGGFAPWVGVYGLGAIAAGVAAAFGFSRLVAARAWLAPGLLLAATLALGAVAGRIDYTRPAGSLSVSLLQGNVPQEEKFATRHVRQALASTVAQLASARGDLVIGPETVIPLLPRPARPGRAGRSCSSAFASRGAPPSSACRSATRSWATPTRRPASRRRPRRCRTASIATTSTTWCRSASSSRPAFAGSPS